MAGYWSKSQRDERNSERGRRAAARYIASRDEEAFISGQTLQAKWADIRAVYREQIVKNVFWILVLVLINTALFLEAAFNFPVFTWLRALGEPGTARGFIVVAATLMLWALLFRLDTLYRAYQFPDGDEHALGVSVEILRRSIIRNRDMHPRIWIFFLLTFLCVAGFLIWNAWFDVWQEIILFLVVFSVLAPFSGFPIRLAKLLWYQDDEDVLNPDGLRRARRKRVRNGPIKRVATACLCIALGVAGAVYLGLSWRDFNTWGLGVFTVCCAALIVGPIPYLFLVRDSFAYPIDEDLGVGQQASEALKQMKDRLSITLGQLESLARDVKIALVTIDNLSGSTKLLEQRAADAEVLAGLSEKAQEAFLRQLDTRDRRSARTNILWVLIGIAATIALGLPPLLATK